MCDALRQQRRALFESLRKSTSWFYYNHLAAYIDRIKGRKEQQCYETHSRKLGTVFRLGLSRRFRTLNANDVIFNFSSRSFSTGEIDALAHGLKFSFASHRLNYQSHFLSYERFYRQLPCEQMYNRTVDAINLVRSALDQIAFSSHYSLSHRLSPYHKRFIATLKELAAADNLIVTRPDNSHGVVLLDKSSYIDKMYQISSDATKFLPCDCEWLKLVIKCEDKVNRFIDSIFKIVIFNDFQTSYSKQLNLNLAYQWYTKRSSF